MRLAAAAALAAALAACGGEPTSGPLPIALGEDVCDVCRMIISEKPYAAQSRLGPSTVERFDDLGCLAERLQKGPPALEVWVVDRDSGAWIDAAAAFLVRRKDLPTPMVSGLAAYSSRASAERAGGELMTLDQLRTRGRP